ncbi:LOW QUALITY PROTEIN: myogenesis-regulating glycosidase-like [Palaemon carinicauda]|uniref:LOW QUALITY PROTEIN: myogenesis-regulating glycosidase-like n=1 Tax=Palaemon carinicauda TaxID=392227 RepID=UPI0035B64CF7
MLSGLVRFALIGIYLDILIYVRCEKLQSLLVKGSHNDLEIANERRIRITHNNGQVNIDWGLTLPEGAEGVDCTEGGFCLDFDVARVVITQEDHCQKISWTARNLTELKDCVLLEGHWFGGGEQVKQPWPLEKTPRQETAFVTADMLQKRDLWYGGVSEAYWISSQGASVKVEEGIPLFLSVPDNDGDGVADQLCLSSRFEEPFPVPDDVHLMLNYYVCTAENIKEVHLASYPKFFSSPTGIPDLRMLQDPIWSTWAEYHTKVNDTRVLDFAMAVKENGFNNSQVEIDDNWETCYGDAKWNPERFPDPASLIDDLHGRGFRVTLWIHPFINDNCESYIYADEKGYFVKDSTGVTQKTHWWQGRSAGIIDFTNPEAVAWWTQRLVDIQTSTGIDSFKFDAGESSWLPNVFTLNVDKQLWPNAYTKYYVDTIAEFGGMIETRVGRGTQRHPIFVRMLDKDSIWGSENGLRTLVPSLFHFGILGYPYVLPDMIGGNAYLGILPSEELFVRWAQANTFMPALQFSILPWGYNEQVVERCREVTSLHTQIIPLISRLAQEAMETGAPIMRPTWWLCPELEACLTADQQFLVGDELLSVPVVYKGATSVSVVIPPGEWKLADSETRYEGPQTITVENITLDSIVYFTRVTSPRL